MGVRVLKNINTVEMWNKKYHPDGVKRVWGDEFRMSLYDFVAEVIPKLPATILDVGGGLGVGAERMMGHCASWIVDSLDFSRTACNKSNVISHCMDIRKDPLRGVYDYIISVQTIEHMEDPLAIIRKLLKGAREAVIITVPFKGNVGGQHMSSFDRSSFDELAPHTITLHKSNKPSRTDMRVVFKK